MNCTLKRTESHLYGVFGELSDEDGNHIAYTLEHAFEFVKEYVPKLAVGTYTCARGVHELHNLMPFSTFEITNVPKFNGCPVKGILFHKGNTNKDSEGCVLLGSSRDALGIAESAKAFDKFMELQKDVDSFLLVVS